MIDIKSDGTKVILDAQTGDGEEPVIRFAWDTGRALFAGLLRDRLRDRLFRKLREIREEAYNQGYKDAKAKVARRQYHAGVF